MNLVKRMEMQRSGVEVATMTPKEGRAVRLSLHWNQRQMALATGISEAAVVRFEQGRPVPPTFVARIEATLRSAVGDRKGADHIRRLLLPDLTGAEVVAVRQALGWRQRDLAEWAGLSIGALHRFENGYPVRAETKATILGTLRAAQGENGDAGGTTPVR